MAKIIRDFDEPISFLQDRAELGSRALGNRSILSQASNSEMKNILNKIKHREDYRPIAPICMEEYAPEVFKPGTPDPFILFDHQVRDNWRGKIPAIKHLDGSARLQTVNKNENKLIIIPLL